MVGSDLSFIVSVSILFVAPSSRRLRGIGGGKSKAEAVLRVVDEVFMVSKIKLSSIINPICNVVTVVAVDNSKPSRRVVDTQTSPIDRAIKQIGASRRVVDTGQ